VKKFKIKSFCKINLSLKVLRKLESGYHSINSLITFCDLYDVISLSKISNSKDKISFSGKFGKGIDIKSNTITKTLYYLRKQGFLKNHKFKINIQKNIPQGSGLGGGSSNAASLLNFLNNKMNLRLNKKKLLKIASMIGHDVPIILEKRNTIITGKKNNILKMREKFNLNILIVYPNIICSTKKIYKNNKKFNYSKNNLSIYKKNKMKFIDSLKRTENDLQETVTRLYPEVGEIINFIEDQKGCYFSRITGSGSACIGIFSNMKAAIFSQNLVKLYFPKYWSLVSKSI